MSSSGKFERMDTLKLQTRFLFVAAALAVAPVAAAVAQSNPTGNLGSNQSVTAAPGTADNKAASGMNTAGVNAMPAVSSAAAVNSATPGGTGKTVVPGSNSSVAGDRAGTAATKTGTTSTPGG